jgi:sirohydrochlorin ferrochelatase
MSAGTSRLLIGNKKNIQQTGIIILAHGSKLRDEKSYPIIETVQSTVGRIVEYVKKKNNCNMVEQAYFKFCKPNIYQSIQTLINKGCKKIIILPFFLFSGNHVIRDIPEIIKKEQQKYKDIKFVITKSLGQDPRILEIILDLINQEMTN